MIYRTYKIASSGELKIDCRKAAPRAQHRGRCKSKTAARQLRRRSRSGDPANQLSGSERVNGVAQGGQPKRSVEHTSVLCVDGVNDVGECYDTYSTYVGFFSGRGIRGGKWENQRRGGTPPAP